MQKYIFILIIPLFFSCKSDAELSMERGIKYFEWGKYKDAVDYRGRSLTDFETFRTGGSRSIGFLLLAPRARYSLEESNRLIKRAAVEAIRAHPRRYLRGLIVGLHESLLFGKMLDYTDETSSYAKARAKVRKGVDVSARDKMLALSI